MLQPWSDFLKMTGIMSIDSLFVFVVDVKCLNPKAIKSELQKKKMDCIITKGMMHSRAVRNVI